MESRVGSPEIDTSVCPYVHVYVYTKYRYVRTYVRMYMYVNVLLVLICMFLIYQVPVMSKEQSSTFCFSSEYQQAGRDTGRLSRLSTEVL